MLPERVFLGSKEPELPTCKVLKGFEKFGGDFFWRVPLPFELIDWDNVWLSVVGWDCVLFVKVTVLCFSFPEEDKDDDIVKVEFRLSDFVRPRDSSLSFENTDGTFGRVGLISEYLWLFCDCDETDETEDVLGEVSFFVEVGTGCDCCLCISNVFWKADCEDFKNEGGCGGEVPIDGNGWMGILTGLR